jgi:TrmH family RNA methyltransferase
MHRTTPHSPLTSRSNETVRYLLSLADAKTRKREHAFLVEGVKTVEEALRGRCGVKLVIASPALASHHGRGVLKLAEETGVEVVWISERLLDAIAESKTPQPALAVVRMPQNESASVLAVDKGLIVLADRVQDPANVGAIIRTAEAAGASGVVLTAGSADPFSHKAVRASMGSILRVPVAHCSDVVAFLRAANTAGYQTVATTPTGDRALYDIDLRVPTVIALGSEGSGLSPAALEAMDHRVRIPMVETIDSLNVAAAATVMLYEAVRQRITV